MTREPAKKHGKWLFAALVLGVCVAILSTLLLANDKRNLRVLLNHYHMAWPFDPAPVTVAGATPQDSKSRRARVPAPVVTVTVPPRMLAPAAVETLGGFARTMRMQGPALCALLAKGGIENNGWAISPYDPQSFECLSEQRVDDADGLGGFASYFLSIRGTPDGEISAIRMKLVTPETVAGAAMKVKFLQALTIVTDESGWRDFGAVVGSVTRLEDFEARHFGINFSFKREFTNADRFNLLILPADTEPAVKRTRDFFGGEGWLIAGPEVETLPRLAPVVPAPASP